MYFWRRLIVGGQKRCWWPQFIEIEGCKSRNSSCLGEAKVEYCEVVPGNVDESGLIGGSRSLL